MAEVDVKFAAITPSAQVADASTQILGVQGGASDLLYTSQQLQTGPFLSNISSSPAFNTAPLVPGAATARGNTGRSSDVINVLDFGADPTNNAATATQTTAAFQAAIDALGSLVPPASWGVTSIGLAGKIYVPPGKYVLSPPVPGGPCLNLPFSGTGSLASLIIEGAGDASQIIASCQGFVFDDVNLTVSNSPQAKPWVMRNMSIRNTYAGVLGSNAYYKQGLVPGAAWSLTATTLQLTNATINATGGFNANGGQILFSVSGGLLSANAVPVYVGYVTSITGRGVGGNATLTLGDVANATSGNKGGAQMASNGVADRLFANQAYFATASWVASAGATPAAIPMAASNPSGVNGGAGLDVGYYNVWDWTYVTNQSASSSVPMPKFVGVVHITGTPTVPTGGWVGNTLTLTQGAQVSSQGAGDLLMLSPLSGCIRHYSTNIATFENLSLTGLICISTDARLLSNNLNNAFIPWLNKVSNCLIGGSVPNGNCAIGEIGVIIGQAGLVQNCQINGNWMCVRLSGQNAKVSCCTMEVCCYGVVIGGFVTIGDPFQSSAGATDFVIENLEMEGCYAAAVAVDTFPANGLISSVVMTANHQNTCHGLYLSSGSGGSGLTVQNSQFFGAGSFGAFWNPSFAGFGGPPSAIFMGFNNSNQTQRKAFIAVQGQANPGAYVLANGYKSTAWTMPTFPGQATYIASNNPPEIFTFSRIPGAQAGVSGYISNGITSGVAGNVLTVTSFAQTVRAGYVGVAVAGGPGTLITSGTSILPNTFLTNTRLDAVGSSYYVNNSQAAGTAGSPLALTVYPISDGQEYLISDSPIPYTPLFTASGAGTAGVDTQISLTINVPAYVTGDMTVFNDTTNAIIGTVRNPTVGPPTSGAIVILNGAALSGWSNSDTILFRPLSNVGTPVTVGGGTNHVRIRWNSAQQNWLIV